MIEIVPGKAPARAVIPGVSGRAGPDDQLGRPGRSRRDERGPGLTGQVLSPYRCGVPSYTSEKDAYLKRLRRIEGQVRGLQRMVEEDKYCIDILTQVSAMTKALQSVALGLLDDHLSHCVVDAAREGGPEAEIKVKEASDAISRLVRS